MSEETFLEKEARILDDIEARGKKARESTGLVSKLPEPGILEAGYIAYVTPPHEVQEKLSAFAEDIRASLFGRSIPYGLVWKNLHTTIGTLGVERVSEFKPDASILENLADVANRTACYVQRGLTLRPYLHLGPAINSEDSVIIRPEGIDQLEELRNAIERGMWEKGYEDFRPAWGRHITIARVKTDILAEHLDYFRELMEGKGKELFKEASGHYSSKIGVGYFLMDDERFVLQPTASFDTLPFAKMPSLWLDGKKAITAPIRNNKD